MLTMAQKIKIARDAAAGPNRPGYHPKGQEPFDPHAWVLDAIEAAYQLGRADVDVPVHALGVVGPVGTLRVGPDTVAALVKVGEHIVDGLQEVVGAINRIGPIEVVTRGRE